MRFITNLIVGAAFAYLCGAPGCPLGPVGLGGAGLALATAVNFLMMFSPALLAFWLEESRPFFWIFQKMTFIFGEGFSSR